MTTILAIAIVAAFAFGRRLQGGLFPSLGSTWERLSYAAIAALSALAWSGDPIMSALIAPAWFGACCIPLFDSIGREDAMWRGAVRGLVQGLPVAAVALYFGHEYAALWFCLGALTGPAYKLGWLLDGATTGKRWHVQGTVAGEYMSGALYGAGLLAAL